MVLDPPPAAAFYRHAAVRARLEEFLGGGDGAVFIAAGTPEEARHRERHAPAELPERLAAGDEINRSLWDRHSLLAHLDLEYVNFDSPAEPYLHPERAFELQEPVIASALSILAAHGICPLHLVTGRGHHLLWKVDLDSPVAAELGALAPVGETLRELYDRETGPRGERVPPRLAAAWAGLGLLMEFLAMQIKQRAAAVCRRPVELGALETGSEAGHDREVIAVDITEYADPVCSRVTRAAFSTYLKPWQQRHLLGAEVAAQLPPIFILPRGTRPLAELLHLMRDPAEAAHLAAESHATIPEQAAGLARLLAAYRGSPLAAFHREFYAEDHDPPEAWPETYDRTPLDALPPCARRMLEEPNDLLLRPACAQRVVRVMLALGWHPRHIAGLIRSKYERDYGWGPQWHGCDPATRADFYARVFAGAIVTEVDELVDFNCRSAREEGLCLVANCHQNLQPFRQSLLDRQHHERLASRPFHGLFLPAEHLRVP